MDELKNLPYPDLERTYAEASTEEKAFLLEKMDGEKTGKLLESTDSDVKRYILSNYPRVVSQAVEKFTWERRWKVENFSNTIDDIVQQTFKMDVSFDGSSIANVHELLLQDKVIKKRKDFVDHIKKFREKYTGEQKFKEKMDAYFSRSPNETPSSSFGTTIREIPGRH